MKKLLLLSTLLLLPEISEAQIFKIRRTSDNGVANSVIDAELLKVQNEINADLPSASSAGRLLDGMVDSQTISAKGFATDYISHFDKVLVGAGVGVGADLEKDKNTDSDASGAGLTGGVMLGLNMSMFADNTFLGLDPKKTSVMFNFMSYNYKSDFDEASASIDMLSFGFNGTYKWKEGGGSRLFGWDGVRLHTGYQYTSAKFGFSTNLNEAIDPVTAGGSTYSGNITGTPKIGIESSSHSIPLEISSGVNFLYILSFYGGLGTDINIGTSKASGAANANPTTLNCSGGGCGTTGTLTAQAEANLEGNGKVQPLYLRGFAGFQINLPFTRIYVHANNVFGTDLYSVATGLRLAF